MSYTILLIGLDQAKLYAAGGVFVEILIFLIFSKGQNGLAIFNVLAHLSRNPGKFEQLRQAPDSLFDQLF